MKFIISISLCILFAGCSSAVIDAETYCHDSKDRLPASTFSVNAYQYIREHQLASTDATKEKWQRYENSFRETLAVMEMGFDKFLTPSNRSSIGKDGIKGFKQKALMLFGKFREKNLLPSAIMIAVAPDIPMPPPFYTGGSHEIIIPFDDLSLENGRAKILPFTMGAAGVSAGAGGGVTFQMGLVFNARTSQEYEGFFFGGGVRVLAGLGGGVFGALGVSYWDGLNIAQAITQPARMQKSLAELWSRPRAFVVGIGAGVGFSAKAFGALSFYVAREPIAIDYHGFKDGLYQALDELFHKDELEDFR